jgi:hypothetical protein
VANRISTVIDFVTNGATRNLSDLKTRIGEADTATGKFKAGMGGLGDVLRTHGAEAALAAGTALVAFGVSSVKAFQETALAAGKFADATGLAVDDASRWAEVASDVGVSGETVTTMFVRLNKAIGDNAPVVANLGIEQQKLADGTTDVNATMVEAIRKLNAIKDPTLRAAAAQDLFGRSYKEAAELIFGSADQLEAKLAAVADAQVIDREELRKARELRDSLDNLSDAVEGFKLTVGETFGDLAGDLLEAKDAVDRLTGGYVDLGKVAQGALSPIGNLSNAIEDVGDKVSDVLGLTPDLRDDIFDQTQGFAAAAATAADLSDELDLQAQYQEVGAAKAEAHEQALADEKAQMERNAATTQRLTDEYNQQRDSIDDLIGRKNALIGGDIAVRQAQRDARTAAAELNTALEDQSLTLEELAPLIDDATQAQLNAAQAAADRRAAELEANGTLVDSKVRNQLLKEELTTLANTVDGPLRNAILRYIDDLNRIPSSVNTNITQNGTDDRRFGAQSLGPNTSTGGLLASAQSFGGSGAGKQLPPINLTVHAGIGTDGRQVGRQIVEALEAFFRSGGQLPPTMAQRLGG